MKNLARQFFYDREYSRAKEIFEGQGMFYEAGLCALLLGDKKGARALWQVCLHPCIGTLWGRLVLEYLDENYNCRASFFQTRAFLEVYINLFIGIGRLDWAEKLINAYKILANSNPEACKFICRVLFANGFIPATQYFINESKNICFMDPELHFIEAEVHYARKDFEESLKSIEQTLEIAPDYFPAKNLKRKILG